MHITETEIRNILTRTSGYLSGITSHSLQPYRGCSFGNSLCGIGCYVQHNRFVTRGLPWGSFLEMRTNAADSYRSHYNKERNWARRRREEFSIFMSSASDPFVPQERQFGTTREVLQVMLELPPDELVVQTHSPLVVDFSEVLVKLAARCRVRVQVSIETDQDRLPGLPPPAGSVKARLEAVKVIHEAGLTAVVVMAPLLPLRDPRQFFGEVSRIADAVIIDHYIEGDGTPSGSRTRNTSLPEAIALLDPAANELAYRDSIVALARKAMPGRVGVGRRGFAGEFG